jgi:hypothetical protein
MYLNPENAIVVVGTTFYPLNLPQKSLDNKYNELVHYYEGATQYLGTYIFVNLRKGKIAEILDEENLLALLFK